MTWIHEYIIYHDGTRQKCARYPDHDKQRALERAELSASYCHDAVIILEDDDGNEFARFPTKKSSPCPPLLTPDDAISLIHQLTLRVARLEKLVHPVQVIQLPRKYTCTACHKIKTLKAGERLPRSPRHCPACAHEHRRIYKRDYERARRAAQKAKRS